MSDAVFNPIATSNKVFDSYKEYISTTVHFADADLQKQLVDILDGDGFLAKGPFLEAAPPYQTDKTVRQLVEEGTLCSSMLTLAGGDTELFNPDRPLYVHQEKAIRKAAMGRNYAVVTGTGSGKTECFLLPIINDIFSEFESEGASPGVRAILLYPMNALANDQLKRLRELLKGTPITFGRYTGETEKTEKDAASKWMIGEQNQERLPNELLSREEIRKNPPNILLTNYSMLEYLLLRPEDASLFGNVFGTRWRHIAIDEAHVYTGALGTEVAYLIRRLKARVAVDSGVKPKMHCYMTSATIGTDEDLPRVAKFAQDLFGEPFSNDIHDLDVIKSVKDDPVESLDETPWGSLPLPLWNELRSVLDSSEGDCTEAEGLRRVLEPHVPAHIMKRLDGAKSPLLGLGAILRGEGSTQSLIRKSGKKLLDLTSLSEMGSLGVDGLEGSPEDVEILSSMVEVLSAAQRSEDVPVLSCRYHSFIRAPEGIFIDLSTRRLIAEKRLLVKREDGESVPVYEVSVCRHCGQAYILGTEAMDDATGVPWLSPRHEGTDADEEFLPHSYYRLLKQSEQKDENEADIIWLCPICGSLHANSVGGKHRYAHEPVDRVPIAKSESTEENATCKHCGYTRRNAIQPMRVSPEAAGSVVCYDLVRDVPAFNSKAEEDSGDYFSEFFYDDVPHAGNIICFSDKRQDAAYFAPAMERTYKNITRRQLIQEAVSELDNGLGAKPSEVITWLCNEAPKRYEGLSGDRGKAEAWVLDELSAIDSRNSLDGLGVVRVYATDCLTGLEDKRVSLTMQSYIDRDLGKTEFPWLTLEDFKTFFAYCLDSLRARGSIEQSMSVDKGDRRNFGQPTYFYFDSMNLKEENCYSFVGNISGAENSRSRFIRAYAQRIHGVILQRADSSAILQALGSFTCSYLKALPKLHIGVRGLKSSRGKEIYQLDKDLWKLYAHDPNDRLYLCDTCGCMTHIDTHGVCITRGCKGSLRPVTYQEASEKDRYYKERYLEGPLPITIKEHTAQLSAEAARNVQQEFLDGKVNVLSCTTTFELGVDVGDLRAIFMRNVPPTTANYAQRAGRVGRRAGKPGFAITFAKLRPHDVAFFRNPRKMIGGSTKPPTCYLDNSLIARRHLFATALSCFFQLPESEASGYSKKYNDFLAVKDAEPTGLEVLRSYLKSRPERLKKQIDSIFPEDSQLAKDLGCEDWQWTDLLVAPGDEFGGGMGRLVRTHGLKHADYESLAKRERSTEDAYVKQRLLGQIARLQKERTIDVLASTGVLPKYGFPTDLVELELTSLTKEAREGYRLQRGLRQAITEYAPGSDVVVDKKLWRSKGIKRLFGRDLEQRRYGNCEHCGTFLPPIDNADEVQECPVCHEQVSLKKRLIVPEYGFEGDLQKSREIGLRRPRTRGYSMIHFAQKWPEEDTGREIILPGGIVKTRQASNAQLYAINENRGAGFWICSRCGAAGDSQDSIDHWKYCKSSATPPVVNHVNALAAPFTSDILELAFQPESPLNRFTPEAWESTMWALHATALRLLEVPGTEIGATHFVNFAGLESVLLYDNVPGGAGHAQQLGNLVEDLIREAFEIVSACDCGEETCCYNCIANYFNQGRQHVLSRGAARDILLVFLQNSVGKEGELSGCVSTQSIPEEGACDIDKVAGGLKLTPAFSGPSFGAAGCAEAFSFAMCRCVDSDEQEFFDRLHALADFLNCSSPYADVTFYDSHGNEADALLVWKDEHVVVVNGESMEEFHESFGDMEEGVKGWRFFFAGVDDPAEVVQALKGDPWL